MNDRTDWLLLEMSLWKQWSFWRTGFNRRMCRVQNAILGAGVQLWRKTQGLIQKPAGGPPFGWAPPEAPLHSWRSNSSATVLQSLTMRLRKLPSIYFHKLRPYQKVPLPSLLWNWERCGKFCLFWVYECDHCMLASDWSPLNVWAYCVLCFFVTAQLLLLQPVMA